MAMRLPCHHSSNIKDYALDPVLRAMSTDGSVMFCVHLGVSEI